MARPVHLLTGADRLDRMPGPWDELIAPFDPRARYDLLYDFIRAAAPEYATTYEEFFEPYPDWDMYAIILEGKLAAHAAIYKLYEGAREVANVWTLPEHRGKGMAAALVRRLAEIILSQGLVPTLTTREDNLPMRAAAIKAGFVEIGQWYHGTPLRLDTLRAGSTITPFAPLAEAFSHRPTMLSIEDDGTISHNGTQPGNLYIIDEPVEMGRDMLPHPRSTMGAEKEWLTARDLQLRKIAECPIGAE